MRMMHERARSVGGVLTAVAAAVLAGCGGGGGSDPTAAESALGAGGGEGQMTEQPNAVALATTDSTGWKWVANEGGAAWLPASATVRFGSGDKWAQKAITGALACTTTTFGSDPAPGIAKTCQMPTTATVVASLAGSMLVQPTVDSNSAGAAEAFMVTAEASGTSQAVNIYLDATNSATRLVVGVYADVSGVPGALMSTGTISTLKAGSWNTVAVGRLAGAVWAAAVQAQANRAKPTRRRVEVFM
jgi:hypothetical protein